MTKQPNSRYCFLCGVQNPIGLKLTFHDEGDCVQARFTPGEEHQGYPGVMHGGIACALLDETIGRTLVRQDIWAMTADLQVRFHKPVPLGQPLTVVGELVRLRSRPMEGKGEIRLADGSVAVSAQAKYIRLTEEQTETFRQELGFWQVIPDGSAPSDSGQGEPERQS
jgi:uncharacterized protein (TIGR00369 family)